MAITDIIQAVRFWLHDDGDSPTFTDAQIQEFLDLEKVKDSSGYLPTETSWTPTYDVLRAAGRGWMWLAGTIGNKPLSYRVGDVSVTMDKEYCVKRAHDLMGAGSATLLRRDESREPEVLDRFRS